ncbi:MAG: YcgL domain-containing protein [Rhodanobacteraceae bacterium]|jgi:hypothetical protein|nr:YcgL domain-containing protein [Rhodanobacteraceae bacterium]
MQCYVYKSPRRADTYVYLRERDGFSVLPAPLLESLGTPVFVLEFELTPQRQLARASAAVVLEDLTQRGFHLQLPPPPDLTLAASEADD